MKKLLIIPALVTLLFLLPSRIQAHPGRTASDGCHYCRTNCVKWGEIEGARHCHNGGSATPKPATPRPTQAPTTPPTVEPVVLGVSASEPPTASPIVTETIEPKVQSSTTSNPVGTALGLGLSLFLGYKGLKWLVRKTNPDEISTV